MTTVGELLNWMDQIAPFHLAESWDNCGLLVGDKNAPVKRAMAALDVTRQVAEEAAENQVDCIVSHHPVIFHPIKSVTAGSVPYFLIQHRISVISAHTNLDIAPGGVCDALASRLGVVDTDVLEPTGGKTFYKVVVFVPTKDAEAVTDAMGAAGAGSLGNYARCSFSHPGTGSFLPLDGASPAVGAVGRREFVEETRVEMLCSQEHLPRVIAAMKEAHPYEEPAFDVFRDEGVNAPYGIGRIGSLPAPVSARELAAITRDALDCGAVRLVGERDGIVRVAFANGAESGLLAAALRAGAHALVAGEVKHNVYVDAQNAGIVLIDAGHFDTENLIVPLLEQRLRKAFPGVMVLPSEQNRRPYQMV